MIEQWRPGEKFVDAQARGPYRAWWHEHRFVSDGDATIMTDTVYYAALSIPLHIVVALALALLLNQKVKAMPIFRTIFYLPSLTSGVATFLLWGNIFEPQAGLLNRFLRHFVENPPGWLTDPAWSKVALVIMGTWSVGSTMLIFLAGLQGIPGQLYEAASIDGAPAETALITSQTWRAAKTISAAAACQVMRRPRLRAGGTLAVARRQRRGSKVDAMLFFSLPGWRFP